MFIFIFLIFTLLSLLWPTSALAVCPACTLVIGAGVGLSRWLGVDDTISGLWVGGLILSTALWTANALRKKFPNIKYPELLSTIVFYLLTLIPLFKWNIIGHPLNKIMGIDKLLLGVILGSLLFFVSTSLDKHLRFKNLGKVVFHYQKVIIPLGLFILMSIFLFIVVK